MDQLKTLAIATLKKHFGYQDFRPLQEEIVLSAARWQDTLALMPTGGGKSICFQVPGLMNPGICLVISPLIALMKDQVDQLRKRGIKAMAIHSGMRKREIDTLLDNCVYGDYKFLYVSPERLKTEIFIERFKKMEVNLIAVDEAHCISQWGYDFRPAYLEIVKIRELAPKVPVIALTASATLTVRKDILEKLNLKNTGVFVQSFARSKTLILLVRWAEKQTARLLPVAIFAEGSGECHFYLSKQERNQGDRSAFQAIGLYRPLRLPCRAGSKGPLPKAHMDWIPGGRTRGNGSYQCLCAIGR